MPTDKPRKRVLSDGSVRWDVQQVLTSEPDAEGRRKRRVRKRTFKTKREAQSWATRIDGKELDGVRFTAEGRDRAKQSLSTYLEEWLDGHENQVRARTIHEYRSICRRYVQAPPSGAPPLGLMRLRELRKADFERLYSWMVKDRGLAARTVQHAHRVLRQALEDAVPDVLPGNPTNKVKVPQASATPEGEAPKGRDRAMSQSQARAFLEAAQECRYFALWAMLLQGGLRPGEALALHWEDVDLESGSVTVRHTLTRTGVEGWDLYPPKSESGMRTVELPKIATEALRAWRVTTAKEKLQVGAEYEDTGGLVFVNPFGKALDLSNLHRGPWRRAMERAGLGTWGERPPKPARGPRGKPRFKPAFRIYDLRHTCATLLDDAGESPARIKYRLGHSSIQITLDNYVHPGKDSDRAAAQALDAVFETGTG